MPYPLKHDFNPHTGIRWAAFAKKGDYDAWLRGYDGPRTFRPNAGKRVRADETYWEKGLFIAVWY